ncbi:MAG: twin-arginine translocase TatA/TatE family subunit [Candidatus Margulisbacteria bacterium]|jgi:sec-independent protein translocase protein TatA|nr:twin-arginine translocase TatA/TatE family subunit [Candidatus Margulisiibacteriota bacterium]
MLGGTELLLIAVVIILLFGGAQLPKLAKSLGRFITEFNEAKDDAEEALQIKKTARKTKKYK